MSELLSVAVAQRLISDEFSVTEIEWVPLGSAYRRVITNDIYATMDLPSFSNSSMDGYAVQAEDTAAASQENPILFQIVGDLPAGSNLDIGIVSGQAVRVMTGAALPRGSDAVVPIEDTLLENDQAGDIILGRLKVLKAVQKGDYIRPEGTDVRKGELLLRQNTQLGPQDIGLLAMLGYVEVPVYRMPRVAIFSSGDELVPVGKPLSSGKIYDSNTYMLVSQVEKYGGEVINLGVAPDEFESVYRILEHAVSEQVDLILSSAGVSVGTYDYVRSVLEKYGRLIFWRVNMRPGKPVTFGRYKDIPFIGLPGNPVSAFVAFEVFVCPILIKMQGKSTWERRIIQVEIEEPIVSDGRESYLRAVVRDHNGTWLGRLTGHQGSGNLRSLVQANALLLIPSEVKSLPVGSRVDGWLLEE